MSKKQDGYVALISMLVVGAACLTIALALLVDGADSQRSVLVTQQSTDARNLAKSCVDEALQQMRENISFTGTGSLTLGVGSCSYTVANTGGDSRIIDAVGTSGNVVRKIQAHATITTSTLSISSWQEVT